MRYIVGIDLGTTNSAVGYVDLHDTRPGEVAISSFDIPQLVGEAIVAERATLPSFLYLPGEYEVRAGALALPWAPDRKYAAGIFARDHGALVPERLVSSAKSWLCHGGVDRETPILPWGAGSDAEKVSPITASSRYLQHIREAWDHTMAAPLSEQTVVLTVPASFDEVARELTLRAAHEAGIPEVILLEEPLAAFYAWLSHHEDNWHAFLSPGDMLLVCDVGGGTTDFTLISCREDTGGPSLDRVAVGDHLLLGGDNMDLALAAEAEQGLGGNLDSAQWQALTHQCRQAKESLLGAEGGERATIRLAGRGRSIIGGSRVTHISRAQADRILLDAFFPEVDAEAGGAAGLPSTEQRGLGLPYVKDRAVTRHLAAFLKRQGGGRLPTAVLFNGGACTPEIVRERIKALLQAWARRPVKALESGSLDLAISWGAAYYGLVRRGLGLRVGGGIARAYFVGVDTGSEQKDGRKAVCLVARGTGEGEQAEVLKTFRVRTNRPVRFSVYSSTTRTGDRVGDVVTVDPDDLVELPGLHTLLRYGRKGRDVTIPVRLGATVTAVGTLELYCESQESPHRWRLQFQLRGAGAAPEKIGAAQPVGVRVIAARAGREKEPRTLTDEDRRSLAGAEAAIRRCFAPKKGEAALSPSELPRRLAQATGMEKELWSLPVLRAMADVLLEVRAGRRRSAGHEGRWFNLAGFCLRPGLGEVTDPWRMKTVWSLYFEGLGFQKDNEARLQWWIFWRRVAGGLGAGHQAQVFSQVAKILCAPPGRKRGKAKAKALRIPLQERREMWLFCANLERLEIDRKVELGRSLLKQIDSGGTWKGSLWALSRLGARQPLYGPANKVVPAREVSAWLAKLRERTWKRKDAVLSAALSMARLTGDRVRDLPVNIRQETAVWLGSLGADEQMLLPLREVVSADRQERNQAFGESLPEGLVMEQTDYPGLCTSSA